MSSPFAAVLSGSDQTSVIKEDDYFIAVLEKQPLAIGHVLVIAKKAVDHWDDLPDESLSNLLLFAKSISKAIKAAIPCQKVGIAVIGLVTRHAHLHLVPINSADDLNFTREKLSPHKTSLEETAEKIRAQIKLPTFK